MAIFLPFFGNGGRKKFRRSTIHPVDKAKGKIVFVTDGGVICKVISCSKEKPVMIDEDKVNVEDQSGLKI